MDMQSKQRMLAVRVDEELYALVKSAAHKREMSISEFVRDMLKAAAEHYVKP